MTQFPRPPFPIQQQPVPGSSESMNPRPDHGEDSYRGAGRLKDKKALITDHLSALVLEGAGPLMFNGAAEKIAPVLWLNHDIIARQLNALHQ